jgi:hypothetical protein
MPRLSESRTRKTSSLRGRRSGAGAQANARSLARRAAGAVAEPEEDGASENWENEDGHLPEMRGIAGMPNNVAGPAPRPVNDTVSNPLLAMRARFLSDFTDWMIGRYPDANPRARMMRQWTEASRLHGAPTQHR